MKSIALTTASPGTFSYTAGQTLYNEMLAHEVLTVMHALTEEGYEITFEEDSDLNSAWSDQTTTLNQQTALLDSLEESEQLGSEWKTRLTSMKLQVASLLSLSQSKANFSARDTAIHVAEALFNSVATISLSSTETSDSDLLDVLKAAFLQETVPGSGVYLTTTLEELKASRTQLEAYAETLDAYAETLETILQAIQDLKYNDEVLEIPATPRPIRIHLLGKSIQQ